MPGPTHIDRVQRITRATKKLAKRSARKMIHLPSQMANDFCLSWDNVTSKATPYGDIVISETAGDIVPENNSMLCIFAHYDRHGSVQPYVFYYLESLREMGVSIVFVTTSELKPEYLEKIRPIVSKAIVRRNIGHDFGSWHIGLSRACDLSNYEKLILANDSVYGPLFGLKEVFEKMDANHVDIWGITDSWENSWHLQSYFLVLNNNVLGSDFFRRFWRGFRYKKNKLNVVNSYEIGFSHRAREAGFLCSAYCEYDSVIKDFLEHPVFFEEWNRDRKRITNFDKIPHNSSYLLWANLIKTFKCPFLKVGLLRDNPKNAPDLSNWRRVVSEFTDYDPQLIEQHLATNDQSH